MSQRQIKHGSPGSRGAKGGGGLAKKEKTQNQKPVDSKFKENVVKKLYDSFQHSFDLDLIASVAHTCQWDLGRSTEALMILGGTATRKGKSSKTVHDDVTKNKTKSLPSTLKSNRPDSEKGNKALYSSQNGLRSNPAHVSTNSLSSGQVWQRHYKSKPQSPGLLTMIPPHGKEVVKLKKTGSARSLPPMSSAPKQSKEWPMVKKTSAAVLRIQQLVQNGMKVMVLMRGVPGSGKTYLAQVVVKLVANSQFAQHMFSTDDYFILLGRGMYAYDSNQLPQAHNWNQKRVSEALRRATNPVVVDNTHTQAWEMQAYVVMAVNHGYLIEVLEPGTPWQTKEAELAKRNIHSVPREKIRQMLDRYEPGWTGDKLLQLFGLKYQHCGADHVPQEVTSYTNSPLAQHRKNAVIDTPEKPKRKRNSPKRKDRRALAGIEITDDRERQLEELNLLFAEYGKTMDEVSKKKVLESGVPISEVVTRMRKLQGSVLPLPKAAIPPTIPEVDHPQRFPSTVVKPVANYGAVARDSPSESLEPDTMSSSNASETSEYETDSDAELAMMKNYGYGCEGRFVEGEDAWEDEDEEDERRAKSEGASSGRRGKFPSLVTSSQEELSLIDYDVSTTPAGSSQEELSLIDFERDDSPNAKDGSSSSSEEQETQLLTLEESLREVLVSNFEKRMALEQERKEKAESEAQKASTFQTVESEGSATAQLETKVEVSDAKTDGFSIISMDGTNNVVLNDSLIDILMKKYMVPAEKAVGRPVEPLPGPACLRDPENNLVEPKKSPDLETIPLPSLPPGGVAPAPLAPSTLPAPPGPSWKADALESIIKSWEYPSEREPHVATAARPKSALLGAIKKTGMERDKSPEELLRSVELSWSSIPFTSSWEELSKRPSGSELPTVPKPQRKTASFTNTTAADFDLWRVDGDGLARIPARSRNINVNYTPTPRSLYLPEVLMLDKSSMTEDEAEMEREAGLDSLATMFPDMPRGQVAEVLDRCTGNLTWAVDELLKESLLSAQLPPKPGAAPGADQGALTDEESAELLAATLDNIIVDGKKTIKRRKDRKNAASELSLLLKKQIEDGIHIGEDHYRDKTLFLRKMRHGEINLEDVVPEPSPAEPEVPPGPAEPAAPLIDFDTGEPEAEVAEDEEEEVVPLKIDASFFTALEKHLGKADVVGAPAQSATVNIPLSLANQIYCCWIETMSRQVEEMESAYDKMVQEDGLLALALQEQERGRRPPDLQEIMDMELAMALYKQDQEQAHGSTRDTMAARLSKSILFDAYPNLDKKALLDLFESEGCSLRRTTAVLSSQGHDQPVTAVPPELALANRLIGHAKAEHGQKEDRKPIVVVKQPKAKGGTRGGSDVLVVDPADFRQEMAMLHEKRNDCCRLAQEAIRKKSYSVASYFSHLAALYKDRIRELNRESISLKLFAEDKPEEVSATLDLHFLLVPEALQVLDLFLDHHMAQLAQRGAPSLDLYLITGRGLRSFQGVSRIKPAVKRRLDQRQLNYVEDNPGMLKVVIHKTDKLSCDV